MTHVYLVTGGEYESYGVYAAFASRGEAEEYIADRKIEAVIEEFAVGREAYKKYWVYKVNNLGEIVVLGFVGDNRTEKCSLYSTYGPPLAPPNRFACNYMGGIVQADTEDEARRAVQQKFAYVKESGQWTDDEIVVKGPRGTEYKKDIK